MEFNSPILCGFVWKHGDKDFSAWEVQLSEEDENAIYAILEKYECDGCSVRNCYDLKINECFE